MLILIKNPTHDTQKENYNREPNDIDPMIVVDPEEDVFGSFPFAVAGSTIAVDVVDVADVCCRRRETTSSPRW